MTNFKEAFKRLDQFIEQKINVVNIPAVAVAVTNREKLIHESYHGYADIAAQTLITLILQFDIGKRIRKEAKHACRTHDLGRVS